MKIFNKRTKNVFSKKWGSENETDSFLFLPANLSASGRNGRPDEYFRASDRSVRFGVVNAQPNGDFRNRIFFDKINEFDSTAGRFHIEGQFGRPDFSEMN